MKTLKIILSVLLMVVFAVGCKTTKDATQLTKTTEIKLPFDGNKYQTDKTTFRSIQSGISENMSTAKEIAMMKSRSEITYSIKTVVKNVADIYSNQLNDENGLKFEVMSRQISKEILTNVKMSDYKVYQDNKNGDFIYWVVVEVKRDDIITNIDNRASQEKIKFDKYQYEKIFNKEMEEYQNSLKPINE